MCERDSRREREKTKGEKSNLSSQKWGGVVVPDLPSRIPQQLFQLTGV